MHSRILREITDVETMATGSGIRESAPLRKRYGRGQWRKRKGVVEIELPSGEILSAELHGGECGGSPGRHGTTRARAPPAEGRSRRYLGGEY